MINAATDGQALKQAQSYTDISSLNAIVRQGKTDQSAALSQVAKQFESILLNMMLTSMRSSVDQLAKDNPLNSSAMQFHQQMMDHQMALSLSEGEGIGIAKILEKQLQRDYGDARSTGAANEHAINIEQYRVSSFAQHATQQAAPVRSIDAQASLSESRPYVSKQAFIDDVLPRFEKAAQKLGVDPHVMLAQSALETGWGQRVIGKANGESSYNLFNIKADSQWQGDRVTVKSLEYIDGIAVQKQSAFRAYDSAEDSVADFIDFLKSNPRYQTALEKTHESEAFVQQLAEAGYATDPLYANKVLEILNDIIDI